MSDLSWLYPTAAGVATAVLGWANRRKLGRAEEKIDNVHREVRPPSNGTTAGGISEAILVATRWNFDQIAHILTILGASPLTPPPELPIPTNPPPRPEERRDEPYHRNQTEPGPEHR